MEKEENKEECELNVASSEVTCKEEGCCKAKASKEKLIEDPDDAEEILDKNGEWSRIY